MRPLLVVGDAPNLPSGLARIASDLTLLLWQHREELGVDVAQLGWGYDGSPWPWRVYPVFDSEEWGQRDILQALRWHCQGAPLDPGPVVLTVWDPSRCYPIASTLRDAGSVELWGYFAIDSENPAGQIGGPAADGLKAYHRVLAYGEYGAGVLERTMNDPEMGLGKVEVPWLPHGLSPLWRPGHPPVRGNEMPREFRKQVDVLVGAVATNQPRKDLALLFDAVRHMQVAAAGAGETVGLWLHTDMITGKAWSVTELATCFGLNRPDGLCVTTDATDEQLAELYGLCDVTIHPGLGEGHCYPIAESLACGTPPIHGDFGGGAALIPEMRWRVDPCAWRYESCYVLRRPVYHAVDFAARAGEAASWKRADRAGMEAYCSGSVAHLRWDALGEKWLETFRAWLKERGRRGAGGE